MSNADIKMSKLTDKIKDIFSRVDIAANGQTNTDYWDDAAANLSAPDGMDYWEWIEQATNDALIEANALVEQNKALIAALEGLCCSPHTRLTKHVLLEVSEVDIDAAIKALKDNS